MDALFFFIHHTSTLENASLCVCKHVHVYVCMSIDQRFMQPRSTRTHEIIHDLLSWKNMLSYTPTEVEGVRVA